MACEECGAGQDIVSDASGEWVVQLHRVGCSKHGTPGTGHCCVPEAEDTQPGKEFHFDELELDDEGFPF